MPLNSTSEPFRSHYAIRVSDNFKMLVPVYVDFGKGWFRIGAATIVGKLERRSKQHQAAAIQQARRHLCPELRARAKYSERKMTGRVVLPQEKRMHPPAEATESAE